MKRVSLFVVLGLVALASCRKRDERPSSSNVASAPAASAPVAAKSFVPSHPVPPFTGTFPHRPEPAANVSGRVAEVTLIRRGKEAWDPCLFAMKNLTNETVSVAQVVLFPYDAIRKGDSREQHNLSPGVVLGPGETKQHEITLHEQLGPETTTIQGEVTVATVGGKGWGNGNLVGGAARPLGGFDAQTLENSAGERVIVDVYELSSNRVRLTNVTDRVVTGAHVSLFYWDAKGTVFEERYASNVELPKELGPGSSIDVDLRVDDKEKGGPTRAAKVMAFAPQVQFADGTHFQNVSLEDYRWLGIVPK